jgi:hypothetical protein
MKSINVIGFSHKGIDEYVHNTFTNLNPPTMKVTRWDVLELDTFRFEAFKGLISSKYRISFYFVYESKRPFEITDRTHHPPCLHRQPMMNLSYRDLATEFSEFHSSPRLNG